jgi:hypothetical protein
MHKVLILHNKDLFDVLMQVKTITACSLENITDTGDVAAMSEAKIIIGDIKHQYQCISGQYFIALGNIPNNQPAEIRSVKKPYHIEQLIEIIQNILAASISETTIIGNFEFNATEQILRNGNVAINLTEKEAALIILLNSKAGEIVSRDEILKKIWGYDKNIDTHTLETHIYRIRKKLGEKNNFIGNNASGYYIESPAG